MSLCPSFQPQNTELVEVVNTVKLWSMSVYLLSVLCEDVSGKHKPLVPHGSKLFIEVKVFKQACEIRDEVKAFLHVTNNAKSLKVVFSSSIVQ